MYNKANEMNAAWMKEVRGLKKEGLLPKDQRILLAAEEIFSCYGYEKTTIDEIIALADVGKGTVYKYFGNKEGLFYKLVQDKNGPFVENLQKAVDGGRTLEEKLVGFFKVMIAFYYENTALWQIICFEMLGANNGCRVQRVNGGVEVVPRFSRIEVTEETKERVLRYHKLLADEFTILYRVLADALAAGELKEDDDPDISCKYIFFGVAMSIFNPGQTMRQKLSSDEAAAIVVDRFLHGDMKREF